MTDFRFNHYVPRWYQERFLPRDGRERKFFYLDLRPEVRRSGSRTYRRADVLRWGPARCFAQQDLYTSTLGEWVSTDIERHFFGELDRKGRRALEYFAEFTHPSVDREAFSDLLLYMSLQKLRTPKGLAQLADLVGAPSRNGILQAMQRLQRIYCATWAEAVWSIVDASASPVKFIVSDHPVTLYNRGCFPASTYCKGHRDPDIRYVGTHTLFPLGLDRALVLTNLSWVRNPYSKPIVLRPNPSYFRDTIFSFTEIQVGRTLTAAEVQEFNYVIKSRALRYVAAAEKEWLYPESRITSIHWDKLGRGYLMMPDPRSVSFSSGVVVGYEDGSRAAWDEYGRRPGQSGFRTRSSQSGEWESFMAFQGEYARVFGPGRRGRGFSFAGREPEQDSPEVHEMHLRQEARYKALLPRTSKVKRRKK